MTYVSHKTRIYPNKTTIKLLDSYFNYRRAIWNRALTVWNDAYDEHLINANQSPTPTWQSVRNELVSNKTDYDVMFPSTILKSTCNQLGKAWKMYFDKTLTKFNRPVFKSKKNTKQSFTVENETSRVMIKNNKLVLPISRDLKHKSYGIRLAEQPRFKGIVKVLTVSKDVTGYYVSFIIKLDEPIPTIKTGLSVGVDANIKHFDSKDGSVNILPDRLLSLYEDVTYYQRALAKKRSANHQFKSNNYRKVITKLQRAYLDINRIQLDILHKYTKQLVKKFDYIAIENLDVIQMKMNKRLAKNLHRSLFGKFKEMIVQKATMYDKTVYKVDRFYPSTQTCSGCGSIKTNDSYGGKHLLSGDSIYHQHQTYRCYECGLVIDRDINAYTNIEHKMLQELQI